MANPYGSADPYSSAGQYGSASPYSSADQYGRVDQYGNAVVRYTPPARRRRRWPWVLIAVLIVLAGLAVVADRIAVRVAQDKTASNLQNSQHLADKPTVAIAGFPFLTQLARHDFNKITVTARGLEVGTDRKVRVSQLILQLNHVTVPSNFSTFRARTAEATALITYADLSHTLGVATSDGGNGRLVAKPSVTILGQKFEATISAVVHASPAKGLTFSDAKVSAVGVSLPGIATDALSAVLNEAVSLYGLPFGGRIVGADVTSSGVLVHLTGSNLTPQS